MTARQDILDHITEAVGNVEAIDGRAYQLGAAGANMADQPAAFIGWTEDRVEYGPANGRFSRFLQVFVVIACQEDTDGLAKTVDALLAAVEEAVMADPTQGGYAYDSRNLSAELRPVIEGVPEGVAAVYLEVQYFVASLGVA